MSQENDRRQRCLSEFRAQYEAEKEQIKKEWREKEEILEELKRHKEFRTPEEKELRRVKNQLKEEREFPIHHPAAFVILILLLVLSIPSYVFAIKGGMPEEMYAWMETTVGNTAFYKVLHIWAVFICWNLVPMVCELISYLGAKSIVARVIISLIVAVMEFIGIMLLDGLAFEGWFCKAVHDDWVYFISFSSRTKEARRLVKEAQKAYDATSREYREKHTTGARRENQEKIAALESDREARYAKFADAENMLLLRERFEEFKKSNLKKYAPEKES